MLKLLLFSLKKSKLLTKIAAESKPKPFNAVELFAQAVSQRQAPSKRDVYIEQLLSLLARDKGTTTLLTTHQKTFDDIRNIIHQLEMTGAGQIVKGHYIPVSSIAFLGQLNTVLQHWDGENFQIDSLDAYNSNLAMARHLIASFE